MEKHTCRLCGRRFHNGRALGGHMRSHAPPARAPSVSSSSSLEGVQDRESETGSPLASTVSDAALEEDVAISLMMLSRDFWSSLQSKGFDDDEHEMGPARPCTAESLPVRHLQASVPVLPSARRAPRQPQEGKPKDPSQAIRSME
ncbi:hypothetical protein J5N97_018479 [Dioscorea zingiberensis]|uniref:C2H2-type domain-containing protein n=1 Tax=Dioscorea zingiberensis TaxID=325984 RepID=A0A9D5CD45_9LILI|nr:hypothetical protein J5N97_018479 [Dioscorea zingiberensis]